MNKIKPNTVHLGDCLEVMKNIEDKSVDLILTDLPYQITSNPWDLIIPFDKLWEQYNRILKLNGVVALTASQPFTSIAVTSNLKNFKHEWIWEKNRGSNFANTVREPMKEHESVLIFSKGKWTYNKQMEERKGTGSKRVPYKVNFKSKSENYRNFEGRENQELNNLRVPSSIQKFNLETGLHPTQKPVKLFEYIIKTYTNENDLILDSCAGSGTTGVAAINLNRNYILIEKEEKYYDIINKRLLDLEPDL